MGVCIAPESCTHKVRSRCGCSPMVFASIAPSSKLQRRRVRSFLVNCICPNAPYIPLCALGKHRFVVQLRRWGRFSGKIGRGSVTKASANHLIGAVNPAQSSRIMGRATRMFESETTPVKCDNQKQRRVAICNGVQSPRLRRVAALTLCSASDKLRIAFGQRCRARSCVFIPVRPVLPGQGGRPFWHRQGRIADNTGAVSGQ